MVIEDRERPPYRPPERVKERHPHPMSVVGVQCVACAVAVLLALLLRFVGGGVYAELRRCFWDTVYRNDLMATLTSLWEDVPSESLSADSVSDDA